MGKKYDIIYADPPWEYKSKECLAKKSILNGELNTHYDTLSIADLKRLDVGGIAQPNSLLFLWVVSPLLREGLEVMEAWGYEYRTIAFVWHKQRPNAGHYTLSECEICLVGKRGKIPTPRGSRSERQFLSELKSKHSAKPAEIRRRITRMFPEQAKIELFARKLSQGWDAWGNEVECSIEIGWKESAE